MLKRFVLAATTLLTIAAAANAQDMSARALQGPGLTQYKGAQTYVDYYIDLVIPLNSGRYDSPDPRFLTDPEKQSLFSAVNFYVGAYGALKKMHESCADYDKYWEQNAYVWRDDTFTHDGKPQSKEQTLANAQKLIKTLKINDTPDLEPHWLAGYDEQAKCDMFAFRRVFGFTVNSAKVFFFLLSESSVRSKMADFYPADKQAASTRFAATVGKKSCWSENSCDDGEYFVEHISEGTDGKQTKLRAPIEKVSTEGCSTTFTLGKPTDLSAGATPRSTFILDWTRVSGVRMLPTAGRDDVIHILGPFLGENDELRIISSAAARNLTGAAAMMIYSCQAAGGR